MHTRTLMALGACVVLAACSTPRYGTRHPGGPGATANPTSAEGYSGSRVPPQGYLMTDRDPLVGRNTEDQDNQFVGTVTYVLYQPNYGDNSRYVALSSRDYYGYLVVPISGLRTSQDMLWVDNTRADLLAQRHYSLAELEEHYPPTNMTQPILSALPVLPGTALPPIAATTPAATAPGGAAPLMIAWHGGAVGAPVYDSTGAYVGVLAAQSVEPSTGVSRYAIVTGPSIGTGYYIAVPASDAQYLNGRVVLDAPMASWSSLPRYQMSQVQQSYGSLGVVQ